MNRKLIFVLLMLIALPGVADDIYQAPQDFIAETFPGNMPEAQALWVKGELKKHIKTLLERNYHKLRIRYWRHEKRSAWILEEIGKERYITTGFVINDGEIERVKILTYRESRGWEVRNSFFTNQFKSVRLNQKQQLSKHIDNITGATLSVRAIKELAQLALHLHAHVNQP